MLYFWRSRVCVFLRSFYCAFFYSRRKIMTDNQEVNVSEETTNNVVVPTDLNENTAFKKSKKKLILPLVIILAVAIIIGIIIACTQIPNKSEDDVFIKHASKIVTMDCNQYKSAIKADKQLTNLNVVKLWDYKGKAHFEEDSNALYVIALEWTCKDAYAYNTLIEHLNEIYGDTASEEKDDDGNETLKWIIASYKGNEEGNKNLSAVKLVKSDIVVIRWETANIAYIIDELINELNEITLESKADLDSIQSMYNDLPEEYVNYVKKYDKLKDYYNSYYELYVEYFDKTVQTLLEKNSAENYDSAEQLLDEYNELDDTYKKQIKNYNLLEKVLKNSKKAKHDELIKELDKIQNSYSPYSDASRVYSILEDFAPLFSKDEIIKYLPYAVYGKAEKKAADYLKRFLKDPASYVEYDNYLGAWCDCEKGLYFVVVNIEYGARNSFNAMVKDKHMIYVYYSVKKGNISYEKCEFSKYDKWEMSN